MNWFRKFMTGRHGGDQLSIFLLVISMILTLLSHLTGISALIIVSYFPLFVAIYRIFSKDKQKRSKENYKYLMLISPIGAKLKKIYSRIKDAKSHKYYRCSQCKKTLRVAKGKGKIKITCPKCKNQFVGKT